MNPEWSTFTATLIVYGGVGRVYQTSLSQHADPGSRGIITRGRNQAGGKTSSQGKDTDRLLSLIATEKLHKTCCYYVMVMPALTTPSCHMLSSRDLL